MFSNDCSHFYWFLIAQRRKTSEEKWFPRPSVYARSYISDQSGVKRFTQVRSKLVGLKKRVSTVLKNAAEHRSTLYSTLAYTDRRTYTYAPTQYT